MTNTRRRHDSPLTSRLAGLLLLAGTLACAGRPDGWNDATHGPDAVPDYDTVFPQDRVVRFDIEIAPGDWQALFDDMTEMVGPFGTNNRGPGQNAGPGDGNQGNAGGGPFVIGGPLADPAACAGLAEGAACRTGAPPRDGRCARVPDLPGLVCNVGLLDFQDGPMEGGPDGNEDAEFLPRTPKYVPCTVRFEGEVWPHVGIRLKGNSTLTGTWSQGIYKLPWRLDFDELADEYPEIDGQRFFGFKILSLTNHASDSSFQREKLVSDLLADAGVPASRTAFARVFIDRGEGSRYFGLYTLVEVPDRPLLRRAFGDDLGNLYKPQGRGARWTLPFDRTAFGKRLAKSRADWSDVEAAVLALNADRTDRVAWRAGLDAVFDTDGFLRWLAVNAAVANWDTYGGLPHNYYLYGSTRDRDRLHWIPWDHDLALAGMGGGGNGPELPALPGLPAEGAPPVIRRNGFGPNSSPFYDGTGDDWPLIRYLLDDPVYRAAYRGHLAEVGARVLVPARVRPLIAARRTLIAPYVVGPEGEVAGYTFLRASGEFDAGVNGLMNTVTSQADAVRQALESRP